MGSPDRGFCALCPAGPPARPRSHATIFLRRRFLVRRYCEFPLNHQPPHSRIFILRHTVGQQASSKVAFTRMVQSCMAGRWLLRESRLGPSLPHAVVWTHTKPEMKVMRGAAHRTPPAWSGLPLLKGLRVNNNRVPNAKG